MVFNNKIKYELHELICNSGGASGADSHFENSCVEYVIKINAFSYKTDYHNSKHKVEISEEDFQEGIIKIKEANKILKRTNISKYINLLARNWAQVKYSDEIFAIGIYENKIDFFLGIISGGTAYACAMAIQAKKTVYFFDQNNSKWHKWSYIIDTWISLKETPTITCKNFAGIGTRKINENGINAIKELFEKSFTMIK